MSNQSGIVASSQLRSFFGSCRDGRVRLVKVSISPAADPCLELDSEQEAAGTWEDDWDRTVPKEIDPDQPCFILYRLDEKDSSGYRWIFLSWSPDHAHTRQKMLYAATKATFKKEFGQGQLKDDYFATMREDVTLAGYKRHLTVEAAPGPLSREEEEMLEIKQSETRVEIGVDSKQATLASLAFPFDRDALNAIETYWKKGYDYLQLGIDLENEIIVLKTKGGCDISELPGKVPEDGAAYHLFRFKHTHEGDYLESNVFVYSMPGYSVSIKERMLYSSCKNAVVDVIEKLYSIEIAKKVEVDSGAELTQEFLQGEIHPVKSLNKPKFARPAAPSRGNKRITKAPPS
eukprot:GFUD01024311.1.p1 GENE.GFUD01024311.1~~GFUD01024311.1.p1  ORF type:complete len:346 (+),score=116.64 GFUD01024311.1:94-1131(+)